MRAFLLCLQAYVLVFAISGSASELRSHLEDLAKRHTRRTENGLHLPILRSQSPSSKRKRRGLQGTVGLGDYSDVVYNVLVTVGGTAMPVLLDTGSSDLWVASASCLDGCGANRTALYPQTTFNRSGFDVQLFYGDSTSGTYAFGPIGTDNVEIAGLTLANQYFAAVNDTNTTITDTDSTGLFGLGFPLNSVIFATLMGTLKPTREPNAERPGLSRDIAAKRRSSVSYGPRPQDIPNPQRPPPNVDHILASFSTFGPLVSRLVTSNSLSEPIFSVTLQRDTVEIGGNVGMLSLGELPPTVKNESLTWVPLRAYTAHQGGLHAPSNSPNEVYPVTWEVFLDDVYFDGERLPRSQLSSPDIQLSALIDTGNSIIRGPPDVMDFIYHRLGQEFPCNEPHTLAFSIGGKLFPVDPRDFVDQAYDNDVSRCTARLAATNTPGEGAFLYSWSLGDPFLRSVLSAYYYGNLTYPSHDAPRMGFLSTIPSDAGQRLKADVNSANQNGGNFPTRVESAPTEPPSGSLGSNGVAQVTATATPSHKSGEILSLGRPCWAVALGFVLGATVSSW